MTEFLPEAAGPQDAVTTTTPRRPGSIRRTTNIDTLRPDGMSADAVVDARARDLRTNADGTTVVVAEASLRARISPSRDLLELQTTPAIPALGELIGGSVGPGFRSRFGALVSEGGSGGFEEGSLLYLLLDDLTGATLVSGYALVRGGGLDPWPEAGEPEGAEPGESPGDNPQLELDPHREAEGESPSSRRIPVSAPSPAVVEPTATPVAIPTRASATPIPQFDAQGDICAGWAHDATMMLHLRDTGLLPVPVGPLAPGLEPEDDPLAWHAMASLPPHAVRRRRRLDLAAAVPSDADHQVEVHFRDSHVDGGGVETIMHEYTLTGTVNPAAGLVVAVSARVQVLPWMECPEALASAERIDGMELAQLRPRVRKEFKGRTTCTHLNDSLRSLADVTALYRELEPNPVA